jgi:hypothetical protein
VVEFIEAATEVGVWGGELGQDVAEPWTQDACVGTSEEPSAAQAKVSQPVEVPVGEGALPVLAREFTEQLDGPRPAGLSDRALIYGVYEYACTSGHSKYKRQIEKAFAESGDGDLVAAHIAFGNDYLCTEDQGRSAVSPSVFDAENRAWLKIEHGVEILNAQQLAHLL